MAYITSPTDTLSHIFRLRKPADVLAYGGMNRRVLTQIPEFMNSQPLITTVAIGAEIKFSLRTREDDVAESPQFHERGDRLPSSSRSKIHRAQGFPLRESRRLRFAATAVGRMPAEL